VTKSMDVTVRSALPSDAARICEIINRCAESGVVLPRTIEDIASSIDGFAVAESGGRVVGCAALVVVDTELAEIRSVAVDPDARTRGIGRRMVHHLAAVAKQLGLSELFLLTRIPGFFESCGFSSVDPAILADRFLDDLMALQGRTYNGKSVMVRSLISSPISTRPAAAQARHAAVA